MAKKDFSKGDRVTFVYAGPAFGWKGTVDYVRPDGHLFVHWDHDPIDSVRFVPSYNVKKEGPK